MGKNGIDEEGRDMGKKSDKNERTRIEIWGRGKCCGK
jgi:hypothetical protein